VLAIVPSLKRLNYSQPPIRTIVRSESFVKQPIIGELQAAAMPLQSIQGHLGQFEDIAGANLRWPNPEYEVTTNERAKSGP
jgi:hypothetical protein